MLHAGCTWSGWAVITQAAAGAVATSSTDQCADDV